MSLISLLVALIVLGVVLYLITLIPMDPVIVTIIRVVAILLVVLWVLKALFGISLGGLTLHAMGAETCFSKGEKADGLNKICYYNCPSGEAAITVKSYQLCPLSIKR